MKKNQDQPANAVELHRRAEERLKRQRPEGGAKKTEVESARLVHELEVHQIEPEMQNEELQRARAQVEDLLAQYTDLYEFAPVGYMTLDREGTIRQVNLTGARLLGVERSRLVNQRLDLLVAEGDRRAFSAFLQKVFASESTASCEVTLPREASPPAVVQLEGTRSADVQECRVVMLDITERRKAEEALRESEARFRMLFDRANDGIFLLSPDGELLSVNESFARMHGYSTGEMLHMNLKDLDTPESSQLAPERMRRLLAGEALIFEVEHYHKDGHVFPLEVSTSPISFGGTLFIQCLHRDVTERRRLEGQLRQAQKMETVGRLAGGVAHDFNNLLTVINGTADLAVRNLKEGDPLRTDFQDIRQAGERAALLTRQLLAFSRKQIMRLEVLNMNTLVAGLRGILQRLIGEDIALVVMPAKEIGGVLADAAQIGQVVMNLVTNARDAMPNGGTLTIEARDVELDEAFAAEHPSVQPGPHVMLAISDTGVGMDEATRARLFEPFFTTKDQGKGTGLGLSMVYGIVKQSGGSTWVHSEPGKGTIFRIYLPRVEEEAHKIQPVPTVPSARGAETILIVEDEDGVRRLVKRLLQAAGYTVLVASTGAEALALLERHDGPVHLVFTDIVMPEMSGWALGAHVEKINPRIKILYTSGYTDAAISRDGRLDKAAHLISKPYTAADLTCKVRAVLDS